MPIGDFLANRQAVGTSGYRAPNALATFAGNPVQNAYDQMFGGPEIGGSDSGDFGGGVSSGVSSGVSGGVSSGVAKGMDSHPSFDVLGTGMGRGSLLGKVGGVVSALSKAPSLGPLGLGSVFGALGTLGDVEEANAVLQTRGLPNINTLSALANNMTMGIFGKSAQQQYNDSYGFSNFDPVGGFGFNDDLPEGFQGFDGYGFSDFGPVGGFGFDDAQPEGFSGFDDNQDSGDLSGPSSGDIDDEASGESDMGQDDY